MRELKRSDLLAFLVALIWLAGITSLYFVRHKPFSPALAVNVVRTAGQLAAALALISIAGGLGAQLLPGRGLHRLERLALQAALGIGVLGLGTLLVGSGVGVWPWLAWLCLILLFFVLRKSVLSWWRSWLGWRKLIQAGGKLEKWLAIGLMIIFGLTLIVSLAPPVKYDALVYHLALPQAYLQAGRIRYMPQIMFWGMPQTGEILYTWAMALAGYQAASVMSWLFGLLAVAGLAGFTHRRLGSRAAWVSVASLLCGYTLADELSWGYVEWLSILFGLGMLSTLDQWRVNGQRKDLILAGVFAGFALGSKYTGGVLLLAGMGVVAWQVLQWSRVDKQPAEARPKKTRNGNLLRLAEGLVCFGLPAVLVTLPWWLKNIWATGNPFYPFFFPGGAMDALRIHLYQGGALWGGWQDALLLPWQATLTGAEGAPGFAASIGPLLLGLGALAWLGWRRRLPEQRRSISTAGIMSVIGLLVWAIAGRLSGLLIQTRLYFSIFPALGFLAGAGFLAIDSIRWQEIRLGFVSGALVLFVFFLNVIHTSQTVQQQGAFAYLFGQQTEKDYLQNNLGWYAAAAERVRQTPDLAPSYMLYEPRSLYCAPRCEPDETLDHWLQARARYGDAQSILDAWRQAGYRSLLVYTRGVEFVREDDERYTTEDWQTLDGLLSHLTKLQDFGGAYALYSLQP